MSDAPAIFADRLAKIYRTVEKGPGIAGALRSLVSPKYREHRAVDGISFAIAPGEVVGYIGVNGAGKSTTIKMLTGILVPSSGTVRVLGRDPHRARAANAREIGVVFGQRTQLWWDLALIESLRLLARIYDVPEPVFRRRLERFSAELELGPLLSTPVRSMSLGQKMRAELAAVFLHAPKVLYLDEPTIGLDVIAKEQLRGFIRAQNEEERTTVVLTTHDLGDIEELCTRVILIDAGHVVYDGPLATIKNRFGRRREISFEVLRSLAELELPPGAEVVDEAEHRVVVCFDRGLATASTVAAAVMNAREVVDFSLVEPDLSSIVKQLHRGSESKERTAA